MRPFEGIRVIDITHVLAGPFAAYQLAVLGADVIKVEHPDEPDQSRGAGTDKELNRRNTGTAFLTQASNKRLITRDLKREKASTTKRLSRNSARGAIRPNRRAASRQR
jgi:crotonobetainyl-CoA:carnitine CoA-transferase CaiB-like acyl-CoA transferase